MRSILIDPVAKTVTEIDEEIDREDVRSLYKILGVENVERAGPLPNGDMVYVNGYGLVDTDGPYFTIQGWHAPLAGKGLLFSDTRSGRIASPRTSLKWAQNAVAFPDIELVGFRNYRFGVEAIFRPRDRRDT